MPPDLRGDTTGGSVPEQMARAERIAAARNPRPHLPKISIDFAVMEPASQQKGKAQVAVVEMPVQWLDVGSWPALAETLEARGVRALARGDALLVDFPNGRPVAGIHGADLGQRASYRIGRYLSSSHCESCVR